MRDALGWWPERACCAWKPDELPNEPDWERGTFSGGEPDPPGAIAPAPAGGFWSAFFFLDEEKMAILLLSEPDRDRVIVRGRVSGRWCWRSRNEVFSAG